ncbi:MAG: crossover junction endodeoxyribonuclease RuvC [bacterium]|nr:crossover junction endodeoxyribonuclease RuvC [bacterium]
MIILGIDPGTATTGYGVIQQSTTPGKGRPWKHIENGCILTSKTMAREKRLWVLEKEMNKLLNLHKPDIVAVETLFFFNNIKTAMPVSEARGVILLCIAKKNIQLKEFGPAQVKLIVTGYGRAEKKDMQEKVKSVFGLREIPKPDDAADALSIALACARALET